MEAKEESIRVIANYIYRENNQLKNASLARINEIMALHKGHLGIIILIFSYLFFNIINIENYGISWDEPIQRELGKVNLDYIIGKTNNSDILSVSNKYYGPFYQILNILVATTIKRFTGLSDIAAYHCLGIFLSTIGILFLYLFSKRLFDDEIAIYSVIFFIFFPQFIAQAHYNTKDIPLMIISLIAIFTMYHAFKCKGHTSILVAGLLSGIVFDMKIVGLEIIPIFFIPYTSYLLINQKVLKSRLELEKEIKLIFVFIITTAFSIFIFWPALWQSPGIFIESIMYFLNHPWIGEVFYLGQYYQARDLPWHYAIIQLIIATPTVTLICLILGIYLTIKRLLITNKKIFENLLITFWFFIPILMEIKPGTTIFDGIRQFILILPALSILAAIGFKKITELLENKYPQGKPKKIITLIILVIFAINLIEIHPYEGSYVNEFTRILIPSHIENWFELEYWGSTYEDGINWLNKNAIPNSTIFALIAPHLMQYYDIRPDLKVCVTRSDFDNIKSRHYVMFFTRNPRSIQDPILRNSSLVYKISRYNSNLLYIFEINNSTMQ